MDNYNILLSDPAWSYRNKRTGGSMKSGSASKYPVLTVEELCDLPIRNIADRDSVLFLWATVPLLPEALQVMKAWGYRYTTKITWHKTGRLGLGFWLRGEVEELLFGIRGKVKAFRSSFPNFIEAPVGKHSEKPEEFRQLIEATAGVKMPNPRMIELFARKPVPGWTTWGLDIDGIDIRERLKGVNP
jgi:N6-adenosine-specific RNA methylase IME4